MLPLEGEEQVAPSRELGGSRRRWNPAAALFNLLAAFLALAERLAAEFQQFSEAYRRRGWHEAMGSSGTIKAICDVSVKMKLTKVSITQDSLAAIREKLLDFDTLESIKLPGLSNERRPIFAGGLLVLDAAFGALGIERMYVSDHAMREGVLYDLLGRDRQEDPRDESIRALQARYEVDTEQAARVEATAMSLFDQAELPWRLDLDNRRLLAWAARIHEIGLVIAHSQYHQHGAYLVENSDIAGFSRTEQQTLAALVRNQRRNPPYNRPPPWIDPRLARLGAQRLKPRCGLFTAQTARPTQTRLRPVSRTAEANIWGVARLRIYPRRAF